jgi:hypothetical protein
MNPSAVLLLLGECFDGVVTGVVLGVAGKACSRADERAVVVRERPRTDSVRRPIATARAWLPASTWTVAEPSNSAAAKVEELQAKGFRVLVVAVGSAELLRLAGVIALSDPPREESAALVAQLHLMAPLPSSIVACVLGAAVALASAWMP